MRDALALNLSPNRHADSFQVMRDDYVRILVANHCANRTTSAIAKEVNKVPNRANRKRNTPILTEIVDIEREKTIHGLQCPLPDARKKTPKTVEGLRRQYKHLMSTLIERVRDTLSYQLR